MTATQVFLLFLRRKCTSKEYCFFRHIITKNHGNKYFKNRALFKHTFVEDYLSRNNRALNNFMTRLFILAPNLKHNRFDNPRFLAIRKQYDSKQRELGSGRFFMSFRSGMYINYYKREWNKFLREYIESDKKFNSPFRKGEKYDFKLKDDIHLRYEG